MPAQLELSWFAPDGGVSPVVDPANVSVEPADLATVVEGKALRCKRTGDGIVRANVGSRSASGRFKCYLAYRLGQTRQWPFRIPLGSPPQESGIFALQNGGVIDQHVVVTVTSDSPDVLDVDSNRLVPKKLGRARITGSAPGPLEGSWEFEVVRPAGYWRIDKAFQPLSLELNPGSYEFSVAYTAEKPLAIEWTRAPQCNYEAKALTHRIPCRLQAPSKVRVRPTRPTDDDDDSLELVELPP